MKHGRFFLGFLVFLCAAALFMGCPNEPDDDTTYGVGEPKEFEVTVTSDASDIKYYSLSTGSQVTNAAKIASKDWDIAFQRPRQIYTNSGASAATTNSGGLGGVWFTNKTKFSDVSAEDKVETTGDYADYAEFTADVVKYTSGMSGPAPSRLNVMTYVGYHGGTGTEGDPYTTVPLQGPPGDDYVPYLYDKKHFVSMTHMMSPTTYALSNQVYIIKHGDGTHYSKVQITEYTSRSADNEAEPPVLAADIVKVKYQNF